MEELTLKEGILPETEEKRRMKIHRNYKEESSKMKRDAHIK